MNEKNDRLEFPVVKRRTARSFIFERRKYKNKTAEELRKMKGGDGGKLVGSTSSKGCPLCNKGKGIEICQKCWKTYTHDL